MITEDYVSFETAKLLKEKGFNEICEMFYCKPHEGYLKNCERDEWWNSNLRKDMTCTCPTLQMAMKWLREVQGLNIYARGVWKDDVQHDYWEPVVVGYDWFVESLTDDTYSKMSKEQFLTYEEACEAAVKYCLENLI